MTGVPVSVADIWIVQHGEKAAGAAPESDPGLTERGRRDARRTGEYLRGKGIGRLYSSPLRRTRETAEIIGEVLGLEVVEDERVRERMNWGDGGAFPPVAEFLEEWRRATDDREYRPRYGDSSREAGERFAAFLEQVCTDSGSGGVAVVSHGGVTVDLVRTLAGEAAVAEANGGAMTRGLESGALTRLRREGGRFRLLALGERSHLLRVTRRPATEADTPFAREAHHGAYRDVVRRQFGEWDEGRQDSFFARDWADAEFEILEVDGVACGYACIEEREEDLHVRELIVHPAHQGRGIGTAVLRETQERARGRGVPVHLGTFLENRAVGLYRRLGFSETGRTDIHVLMEWRPE